MIINGATLDHQKLPVYDICIVGCGAVGISMAHRLRHGKKKDNTPLQIVVLESGVKNIEVPRLPLGTIHGYDPIISLPPQLKVEDLRTGESSKWGQVFNRALLPN